MPLPILAVLPWIIKGAVVAAKSKGAAAVLVKAAAIGTKTIGAGATTGAFFTGLAVAGGIAWTNENVRRFVQACELFDEGDLDGAARKLKSLAVSIKTVGHSDFAEDLLSWVEQGAPIDSQLFDLIESGRGLVEEAVETART